jgi:hypothetical protein
VRLEKEAAGEKPCEPAVFGGDDAISIAVLPKWRSQLAQLGPYFASLADPLILAAECSFFDRLRRFKTDPSSAADFLSAVAEFVAVGPGLQGAGLAKDKPVIVSLALTSPFDISIAMERLALSAREKSLPDLAARVTLAASDESALARYLEHEFAIEGTCQTMHSGRDDDASRVCNLKGGGALALRAGTGIVLVDLMSRWATSEALAPPGHRRPYFAPAREARVDSPSARRVDIDPLRDPFIEAEAALIDGRRRVEAIHDEMVRRGAILSATVPGRSVLSITETLSMQNLRELILSANPGVFDPGPALALSGAELIGGFLLASPGHLELQETRIALAVGDSVRLTWESRLTARGAALLNGALAPLAYTDRGADLEGVVASLRPPVLWPGGYVVQGFDLATLFLQSPLLTVKSISTMMPADRRGLPDVFGEIADGLWLRDLSWRWTTQGQGTMGSLRAMLPADKGSEPIFDARAWIASSQVVRAEVCVLPTRRPCRQSEWRWDSPVREAATSGEPALPRCWEEALADLQQLLWRFGEAVPPSMEEPDWSRYVAGLRDKLACASMDPNVGPSAKRIEHALDRFTAQAGRFPFAERLPITSIW